VTDGWDGDPLAPGPEVLGATGCVRKAVVTVLAAGAVAVAGLSRAVAINETRRKSRLLYR
jgi:hypothetical protein